MGVSFTSFLCDREKENSSGSSTSEAASRLLYKEQAGQCPAIKRFLDYARNDKGETRDGRGVIAVREPSL